MGELGGKGGSVVVGEYFSMGDCGEDFGVAGMRGNVVDS